MTLQFFGTGGAIHTRRLTNTSFVVRQGSSTVLVDASGSPVHDLLNAGVDPPALGALVLTHAHTDHVYAFPSLIHNLWLMGRSKPLDVITNQETQEIATQLCNTLGLFSKSGLFEIGWYVGQDIVHDVGVNDSSKLTVRLFPVQHSVATSGIVFQAG
ncbi:MAG: MBL fold metallo-hydrolase, partial [Spirochaetota bacterium]|nr:MBL fold metallo-hydrolase [Spirochaetota bacterium]